jgi:hypothetical protein
LNTPNLWQVLPRSLPWAAALLQRSKGADLIVQSNILDLAPNHVRVLFLKEVLTKHASRIRELDLIWISSPTLAALFENVQKSSLRLHSLTLKLTVPFEGPGFPTGIMETENLRTLTVERCDGPWYSLSLPSLTNLKLYNTPTRPSLLECRNAPGASCIDAS